MQKLINEANMLHLKYCGGKITYVEFILMAGQLLNAAILISSKEEVEKAFSLKLNGLVNA